jgi:hypothetical protein
VLGSTVIGTAIGLVVLFAVAALLCSGVTETISNITQLRARYLLTGLRAMLDEPEAGSTADDDRTDAGKPGAVTAVDKAVKATLHEQVKEPAQTARAAIQVKEAATDDTKKLTNGSPFTLALFNSPLISSLQTRRIAVKQTGRLRNPQYISSTTFREALVDTLLPDPSGPGPVLDQLERAVRNLPDGPLRGSLVAFIAQSEGNLGRFEASVERWYDEQMSRISGWYKRWARVALGVVGFVAAVLINIDTVQVSHALYVDSPLRDAIQTSADSGTLCQGETTASARASCARQELANFQVLGLPFGYQSGCDSVIHPARCWAWSSATRLHWWDFPLKLLGWLITAFAVSFGAPFWFDALSRLGSLRSSGPKPQPATTT